MTSWSNHLNAFDVIMERFFDVRFLPRIGPPECGGETSVGDHLNCIISWTRAGFTCEGNPKHIGNLFHLLGFGENTEGVDTPSVNGGGKGLSYAAAELPAKESARYQSYVAEELTDKEAKLFRAAAGTLQYIAQDTAAFKQATAEVMLGMAMPRRIHQLRLLRVARYLIRHPGEVWHYLYPAQPWSGVRSLPFRLGW